VLEPGEEPRKNIWYVVSSPTSEIRPSKRSGHQLTSSGHLVGGATPDGLVSDSYLKLDTYSHSWESTEITGFDTIEHFAGETVDGRLVVLNSACEDGAVKVEEKHEANGKLNYDIEKSTWKSLKGELPVPRTTHESCAVVDNKLVVFSGAYQGQIVDNGLYVYDLGAQKWQKVKVKGSRIPARHGHTMSAIGPTTVAIFGGMADMGCFFNDLYTINLTNSRASNVTPKSPLPAQRASHASADIPDSQKFFIHGGLTLNSGMPQVLEDLWQYDAAQNTWTELTKASEVALPTPRLSHSMTVMKFPVYQNEITPTATQATTEESSKNSEAPTLVELDSWRAVSEAETTDQTTSAIPPSKETSPKRVEKTVSVLALFGGMDMQGNFFDDLMVYPV